MQGVGGYDVVRLRADNPGPLTLSGTNTWVLGRDPAWVIDPGPALPAHVDAVAAEVAARGGAGGIAITHDHADHVEGLDALRERLGGAAVPVAAARHPADVRLRDGGAFGPLRALRVPGHAADHMVLLAGRVCFTGDAVLGEGSVFVMEELAGYLAALERLRALAPAVLCPGHGPAVLDADAKLAEYLAHRAEREARLVAALERGVRGEAALLDAAWPEAPPGLRGVAALSLGAHLEKLGAERRLPPDVAA